MTYFYDQESKRLTRLLVLKDVVAEHLIHTEPCPLLMSQLNELEVLLTKLQSEVRAAQAMTRDAIHRGKE